MIASLMNKVDNYLRCQEYDPVSFYGVVVNSALQSLPSLCLGHGPEPNVTRLRESSKDCQSLSTEK
jgi:hypothetical protein